MMFTDYYVGWPGSVHDARVFRNSEIYDLATNSTSEWFPNDSHLVGDSAYPNLTWLLAPYKDNGSSTRKHRNYNFKHSSTRMEIECAFGLLNGRFRRLKFVDMVNMDSIVKVIASVCVLHNVCLTTEDDWEEMMDDEPFPDDEDSLTSSTSTTTLSSSAANLKRAYIADLLENH